MGCIGLVEADWSGCSYLLLILTSFWLVLFKDITDSGAKKFTEDDLAGFVNKTEQESKLVGAKLIMHVVWRRKPL